MPQAIIKEMNLPHTSSSRLWFLVIVLSILLHILLIGWFSSKTPKFPDVNANEFKVGLMTSEGMGDTLKASLPVVQTASDIESEESTVVTEQEVAAEIPSQPILALKEQVPIEQSPVDAIEVAKVIRPETSSLPDISPPALNSASEPVDEKTELSQPIDIVPVITTAIVPVSAAVEADNVEMIGITADVEDVTPSDDFFKPAEIISADEPFTALPIEHLSAIPAPEAIEANITPDVANYDVEILEIKAHDLVIKPKPVRKPTEDNFLGSKKNLVTSSGGKSVVPASQPVSESPKTEPLVIPPAYMLELKSWLNLYKKYPQKAHRLNQQGVVIVSLKIEKTGKIISSEVKRSSGHKLLDQEVDNMIKRASKLPALPANFPRDELELLIPIRFKVK